MPAAVRLRAARHSVVVRDDGDGGPLLVVVPDGQGFGRYLAEILRAEGIGAFSVVGERSLSGELLARHALVLVAAGIESLRSTALIEARVREGAGLVVMRPAHRFGPLLGVEVLPDVVDEGYLQVCPPLGGGGVAGRPMQVHASARPLRPSGATIVADLLDAERQPTARAAVTLHRPSGGGVAVAFAYDLARSVALTRQGNPAWAGQNRDADLTIRSNDLFYGAHPEDPQPDWVDADLLDLPQADEQQRLLVHLLHVVNPGAPLPQAWYLPDAHRAAVVLTGDDHGGDGMVSRFDELRALDADEGEDRGAWSEVRATSYTVPEAALSEEDALGLHRAGFEISLHATAHQNRFSPASLHRDLAQELRAFRSQYPTLPAPTTHRTHSVPWSDWSSQAEVEAALGIRMDANYYWFPGPWVADRPAFFTGSGLPMRFARADGAVIDCFQLVTQMTDEAKQSYPATIDALLDGCLADGGPVAVLTANMHTDLAESHGADAIVSSARRRGVPVVSARQVLNWLDARQASLLRTRRTGDTVTVEVDPHPAARGLVAMVPLRADDAGPSEISVDGRSLPFWHQEHAGHRYVAFAAVPGVVTMSLTASAAEVASAPPAGPVRGRTPPVAPARTRLSCSDFAAGSSNGTVLSRARGGSVVLAPHLGLEPGSDGAVPAGWRVVPAAGGVVAERDGLRLTGARLVAAEALEPGRAVEAEVVLSGTLGEHVGLEGPGGALAVIRTEPTGRLALVAGSTGEQQLAPVPGLWVGAPHRLRVLWQPGLVAAFVDGWPVAELRVRVPGPLCPSLASSLTGDGLVVRWGRVSPFRATGVHTSAVVDAGETVTWHDASVVAVAESMTSARAWLRAGPTPYPDGTWTPFALAALAGGSLSLRGRYAQYRLDLATGWHTTPEVEEVVLVWSGS